jgi:hypothetical protein
MKKVATRDGILWRRLIGFAVSAFAVFVFASASFADTLMTLTGVGDGATLGNVYVDPYTATVGGVANTTVICDDWSNNSYMNESWTATAVSALTVSNASLGTPMFGNNQTLYNEVTYLASQLMANPTNTTNQVEYSFAIWMLTYPYSASPESPAPMTFLAENLSGGTSNSEYIAAVADMNYAIENESGYNSAGWEILTPDPYTSNPAGDGTPQEFLTYVPEPSTILMLLLGLGGVLVLSWRQRKLRSELAA